MKHQYSPENTGYKHLQQVLQKIEAVKKELFSISPDEFMQSLDELEEEQYCLPATLPFTGNPLINNSEKSNCVKNLENAYSVANDEPQPLIIVQDATLVIIREDSGNEIILTPKLCEAALNLFNILAPVHKCKHCDRPITKEQADKFSTLSYKMCDNCEDLELNS